MKKHGLQIRKTITFVLLLSLITTFSTSAYTTKTTGASTIAPSNMEFKSAKNPMYAKKMQTISGAISNAYKMNIYHYECQEGGYYQIYSTGSNDMVGAVFEEEGIINISYKKRASNDNGKIDSKNNFSMTVKMDKNEDYYACVRGYKDTTGAYALHIEPNKDKTWYKNYGVWTADKLPNFAAMSGVWTNRKIYLTKEQAILAYWTLDPATEIVAGKSSYTVRQLKSLYQGNPSKVLNIYTTALSSVVGISSNSLGITVSVLSLFLGDIFTEKDIKGELKSKLVNVCGVKHKANAKTLSGSWSAQNGIVITETFTGTPGMTYIYSYGKHKGGVLTGEEWYYGKWKY